MMRSPLPPGSLLSLVGLALVAGEAIATAGERDAAAESRPPIVVFLSDDHTATDSDLYPPPGQRAPLPPNDIPTPNLVRIAKAGLTMDAAYVASPSCAPSRAALLTGLVPARNGANANHSRPREDIKKLPAYLQELGYEVAAFGKVAHYRHTPEYGFDHAAYFDYHRDEAIEKSIEWLRERQTTGDSKRPLALFVGTNWPHVPWIRDTTFDPASLTVPPHHVNTPETHQARAEYAESVAQMDRELGAVYDAAYELLGQDTFFLHTSDHGAQWPFAKWNLLEEGVRTPMVAVWPGRIAAGTRNDAVVSWLDILPTLVDVAGGTPPRSTLGSEDGLVAWGERGPIEDGVLDGRSLLPVFRGEVAGHRRGIVTQHAGDRSYNVFPTRAVRVGRYKLIRNLHPDWLFTSHVTEVAGGGRDTTLYWPSWETAARSNTEAAGIVERSLRRPPEQLFDLEADPLELDNLLEGDLTPEQTAAAEDLRTQLAAWRARYGDAETISGVPKLAPRGEQPQRGTDDISQPLNIVNVFIDDMGQADLGCFGGPVATPNIDRLAREGRRFTQFYVNSPICSPSRVALTTGQWPARHRITSYLAHRTVNAQRGMADWLEESAPTLPRDLATAGYACGHFGKWHMGGQRDVGEAPLPTAYGFDASLVNFEGLGPRLLPLKTNPLDPTAAPKKHALGSDTLGRGPITWTDRSVVTAGFVEAAIGFIDETAAADRRFYVNLWPDDVHSPFFPPAAQWPTDEQGQGQPPLTRDSSPAAKRAFYDAVLHAMDEQLGPLFDRIRNDPHLARTTIITLCSDNGPEIGAGRNGRYRGGKATLYEGGLRSPLIVWAPGVMEPAGVGGVDDESVFSAVDLVASLRPLAGLPRDGRLDGQNLTAVVLGQVTGSRPNPLYWRRPPDRDQWWLAPSTAEQPQPQAAGAKQSMPDLAIRSDRMKLLCAFDGSEPQLYDVVADPAERNNLAGKRRSVLERLRKDLMRWHAAMPSDAASKASKQR